MSESPSSESPSNNTQHHVSRRPSNLGSSESPGTSSESPATSDQKARATLSKLKEEEGVTKAKSLLRETENLISNVLKENGVVAPETLAKNMVRDLMVKKESEILESPKFSTMLDLVSNYLDSQVLNPDIVSKVKTALEDKVYEEKKNNSKLKYW